MIDQHISRCAIIALVISTLFLSGCSDSQSLNGVAPASISRRQVTDEMPGRILNNLSIKEFLEVCGFMAADLSSSRVVQEADRPIVLEVARLEDHTAPEVRPVPQIYSVAIREKLLNMGHGMIAFRDKRLYDECYARTISASLSTPARQKAADVRMSQLAKVDYLLSGFVYGQDEVSRDRRHAFRYYRIHFLLTDVSTGLIAWEKHYDLKNEGVLRK